MKKVYMLAAACVLAASVFCGCGRKADDTGQLQSFVSEINSQPGKELANGTVLLKCEYQKGDSLFTYHIKVGDKRFDEVSAESSPVTSPRLTWRSLSGCCLATA